MALSKDTFIKERVCKSYQRVKNEPGYCSNQEVAHFYQIEKIGPIEWIVYANREWDDDHITNVLPIVAGKVVDLGNAWKLGPAVTDKVVQFNKFVKKCFLQATESEVTQVLDFANYYHNKELDWLKDVEKAINLRNELHKAYWSRYES